MKELTIEQKAKAYNEAIERAKEIMECSKKSDSKAVRMVLSFFPELKESGDEMIRNDLIRFIKGCFPDETSEQRKTYLAWLEKQKEFVSADFDDVWETADCEELTAPLEKYSKEAIKKMCHAWYDKGIELERRKWLEKQGEQKPVVIPKFRVGDFVKDANYHGEPTYEIVGMDGECYICQYRGNKSMGDRSVMHFCFDNPYLRLVEQKSAWSEDDEGILDEIIDFLENGTVKLQHDLSLYASWLKSLKDRSTWKPSDGQMIALNDVITNGHLSNANERILKGLQEQLKKLKGE